MFGLEIHKTNNLLLVGYLRNWPAEPKKKEDKMQEKESHQLNVLVDLVKNKWGDNAVEAFAGLLSTVVTQRQIEFLIDDLKGEL